MWPIILGGSGILVAVLGWLVQNVSNKEVTKFHKLMLIYFWFFSFFPLILIPTEVFLKVKEGGAALTSSIAKKELEIERNQSMYERLDVPAFDDQFDQQKTSAIIPDLNFSNRGIIDPNSEDSPQDEKEQKASLKEAGDKDLVRGANQKGDFAKSDIVMDDSKVQARKNDEYQMDEKISRKQKTKPALYQQPPNKNPARKGSKISPRKSTHERTLEALPQDGKVYTNDIEQPPIETYPLNSNDINKYTTSKTPDDWESNNFVVYMMTHKDDHFLYELWLAYYFCTFLNGWFLLPLVVYYFLSGEFYFKTKVVDSIKYNLKYYFVMFVIMLAVLLILIFKKQNLKDVFRVSLSVYNSVLYAVFLVSMAHGVARLPVKYSKVRSVQKTYARQVGTFIAKKRRYSEAVLSMNRFYFILQNMDEVTIDKFDREKRIIYEIFEQVKLVELDYAERLKLKEDKHLKTPKFELRNFVQLHYKIIRLNFQLQMHRAYVFENLKKVLRLNRLCHRLYKSPIHFREPEFKELNVDGLVKKPCLFRCLPSLEKPFYSKLRPCSQLSLCVFLGLSSLFVFLVETCGCFMEKHILHIVQRIGNSPLGIMLIIYFIAYLAFCAYYFFFRFNVFGVVGIKRGKKSNVYSLFYSSSMFVYLTYPICINVFHLFIGEENTCFDQALGKQELAAIGSVSLFTLAPFVIAIVVMLTFFNVFGRILQKLGIGVENLQENQLTEDDLETLQEKLNEEVLEILEDYTEYQHARHRLGRSQNLIDKFF